MRSKRRTDGENGERDSCFLTAEFKCELSEKSNGNQQT